MNVSKIVFIDFDGTIVHEDSLDLLFEKFAHPSWKVKDKEWEVGKIGSLENLSFAFSTFEVTNEKLDSIISMLTVTEGFFEFLKFIRALHYEVVIISEGVDYIIRKVIKDKNIKIYSNKFVNNRIVFKKNFENCKFLDQCQKCSLCKVSIINSYQNYFKIYIGDGLSDRYAVKECDLIFAKKSLLENCKKAIAFNHFTDIENFLKDKL